MGFINWLQQRLEMLRSAGLCERCSRLLVPLIGSHFEQRSADGSKAIEAHGRLIRCAWRSAYPPEGGEDLYQCQDCGAWWGHSVWTCVPQESLSRYRVRSIEAWAKKWSFGGVV
jgi:hypothetical protein